MEINTTINKNLATKELIQVKFREIGINLWFYLIGFLILIIFLTIVNTKEFALIGLIIWAIVYKVFFYRKNYRKTQIIGELKLNDNEINLIKGENNGLFEIHKLTNLKIMYAGYDGMKIGRYVDNGDYNKISFNYLGKDYENQFDLDSKERIEDLKKLFQVWYDNQIKFKEYYKGQRSFLFKVNFEYAEIQELKDKYKLDWV